MEWVLHRSLPLNRIVIINQGGMAVGAFYKIVNDDGKNTALVITGNTKCQITVHVTINRYLFDWHFNWRGLLAISESEQPGETLNSFSRNLAGIISCG